MATNADPEYEPTKPHAVTPTPLSTTAGDRCANCATELASDQRYCINCGERRGKPRFETAALEAQPLTSTAFATVTDAPFGPPPRFSSSATLITGVATLLVAMGLGFLIGHDSANSSNRAVPAAAAPAQPVKVTINGGGSSGASGSSSSAGSSHARHGGKSTSTHAAPPAHITKKAVTQGAAAASKVLGGGSTKLASPTVSQGGACSGGSGCQGGKFTGNFFGQ